MWNARMVEAQAGIKIARRNIDVLRYADDTTNGIKQKGSKEILESPLDSKVMKLVSPKGSQPWIFIGRTDAKAEASILWPPHVKDPDAGKDWRQEEKWAAEDKMIRWYHRLNGCEFMQTPGDREGYRKGWHAAVHGIAKTRTQLINWITFSNIIISIAGQTV